VLIVYTENTNVSEVLEILAAKQQYLCTQFKNSLFGLRVLEADGLMVNEELWLTGNRTFATYGLMSGTV
jgi:hypothetical protein